MRALLALLAASFGVAFLWNLQEEQQRSWQLGVMKSLPLNILSRVWGEVHRLTLPTSLRSPMYHLWTYLFDCNLDEASEPLDSYPNLSAFFVRHLKPGTRPLAPADLVSPVDARVTVIGRVGLDGRLEQIKGMTYELSDFLGFVPPPVTTPTLPSSSSPAPSPSSSSSSPPSSPPSSLHYIVFYLAPGDYHRIHNPVTSVYQHRRHFPGHLFPVNPAVAAYVPSLFCRNERVVLAGAWRAEEEQSVVGVGEGVGKGVGEEVGGGKGGGLGRFFSMTMVGAYNVGSVKLSYDETLVTNRRRRWRERWKRGDKGGEQRVGMDVRGEKEVGLTDSVDGAEGYVKVYGKAHVEGGQVKPAVGGAAQEVEEREDVNGLRVKKGEEVARFELGSTVVLVFETLDGEDWEWQVKEGDKVRMGQAVGTIRHTPTEQQ